EAEGPCVNGLLHHLFHAADVLRCGRLVAGPPVAHHVGAHRPVGDLGADVDRPPPSFEGVEVLGERLPLPPDALGQGGAGDVLHALHGPDEPLVPVGHGRGEADAAVAGDDGGDTVPAARGQDLVPGGLAVVVGVDVHPTGGDQEAVGIHRAGSRLTGEGSDAADAPVVHRNIGGACRRSGAVDDRPASDHEVMHVLFPFDDCSRWWHGPMAHATDAQRERRPDVRPTSAQRGGIEYVTWALATTSSLPTEYMATSTTASRFPNLSRVPIATTSTRAGLRRKSMCRLVVTDSATGPI